MPLAARRSHRGVPLADPWHHHLPGRSRGGRLPPRDGIERYPPCNIGLNMRHNPVTARVWWIIRTTRPPYPRTQAATTASPQGHGRRNGVLRSALAPLGRQRSTGRGAGAVSDERIRRPWLSPRAHPGLLVAVAGVARRGRPR